MDTYLYDKKIQCPVCNNEFETKKVRTKFIKVLDRDTDFKATYEYANPTFYGVDVCPKCGHARFESDFSQVNPPAKEIIKERISSKWNPKSFSKERSVKDVIEAHKLALINYTVTNYKFSAIAKVCLRLSWLFQENEPTMAAKFAVHAREHFEKAYSEESFDSNPKEEITIVYLIAELYRREKKYKDAMDWFTIGLRHPSLKSDKKLNDLLREQLLVTKESYKKEKEV